jgi:hypothetical protein
MMNSASSHFADRRGSMPSRRLANGLVLGDEERVAQLVRDDDRADPSRSRSLTISSSMVVP